MGDFLCSFGLIPIGPLCSCFAFAGIEVRNLGRFSSVIAAQVEIDIHSIKRFSVR